MSSRTTEREWETIGDLELLLRRESLRQLLEDSGVPVEKVACDYIRFKPGIGALLGLRLDLKTAPGEVISLPGYIRTHPAGRASQLIRKWHVGRTVPTDVGDGVRLLAGGKSVLFLYPNDARIRGLRFVADKDKLKRLLGELDCFGGDEWRIRARKSNLRTVRYKPERRLIMLCRLGLKNDRTGERQQREVFLRFFADRRGRQIARLTRTLREQAVGRFVPLPLGSTSGGRLFVEEAVNGKEILCDVLAGRGDPEPVAEALALLHASHVPDQPELRLEDMLRTADESARNLMVVDADLGALAVRIVELLVRRRPDEGPQATLHGDCHLHQFLSTETGPVLVDFERSVRGHPLYDLGLLSAHLEILARREPDAVDAISEFRSSLLTHYARYNPQAHMEDLPFFAVCGFLERALLPFRRLEEDWRDRTRSVLNLALESLDRRRE